MGGGKEHAFAGDPVDVGRFITYYALIVRRTVPGPDVVADDDKHVGRVLCCSCQRQRNNCGNRYQSNEPFHTSV